MEVTFFLNTTIDFFATWLERDTSADRINGKLDFPIEEGRILLDEAEYPLSTNNVAYMDMFGRRIVRSSEGVEREEELGPVVHFFMMRLASERLEVTVQCEEPAVMDYLTELLGRIAECWPEAAEVIPRVMEPRKREKQAARPLPDYFPKTEKARKRWKDAYSIIKKIQREYRRLYRDGDTERPKPTFDEYRGRLGSSRLAWTPSDKTIRRIIHCGDEGLLK